MAIKGTAEEQCYEYGGSFKAFKHELSEQDLIMEELFKLKDRLLTISIVTFGCKSLCFIHESNALKKDSIKKSDQAKKVSIKMVDLMNRDLKERRARFYEQEEKAIIKMVDLMNQDLKERRAKLDVLIKETERFPYIEIKPCSDKIPSVTGHESPNIFLNRTPFNVVYGQENCNTDNRNQITLNHTFTIKSRLNDLSGFIKKNVGSDFKTTFEISSIRKDMFFKKEIVVLPDGNPQTQITFLENKTQAVDIKINMQGPLRILFHYTPEKASLKIRFYNKKMNSLLSKPKDLFSSGQTISEKTIAPLNSEATVYTETSNHEQSMLPPINNSIINNASIASVAFIFSVTFSTLLKIIFRRNRETFYEIDSDDDFLEQ